MVVYLESVETDYNSEITEMVSFYPRVIVGCLLTDVVNSVRQAASGPITCPQSVTAEVVMSSLGQCEATQVTQPTNNLLTADFTTSLLCARRTLERADCLLSPDMFV